MNDLAQYQDRLEAKLVELQGRAGRLEADLAEPLSADFADQAAQTEDDEAQEAEDALITDEMDAVKAALSRIKDGSYGQCMRCGNDIQERRLEVIPEAAFCIECATRAEG